MSLTIVTPFGGYEDPYLDEWAEGLRDVCICAGDIEVLWLDNSLSPVFGEHLVGLSGVIPAPVRILEERLQIADPTALRPPEGLQEGKEVQASLMWQRGRMEVQTEWVLCLESDAIPPPDVIERLTDSLEYVSPIGAISANIPCGGKQAEWVVPMVWRMVSEPDSADSGFPEPGLRARPVEWHRSTGPEEPDGVEIVDAIPFGCTLMRLTTMLSVPLGPTWPPCVNYGSDQLFCRALREERGLFVAIHWGVRCGHIKKMPDGSYRDLRDVIPNTAN